MSPASALVDGTRRTLPRSPSWTRKDVAGVTANIIALALPPPRLVDHLREVWEAGDTAFPLDPHAPRAQRRELLALVRPGLLIEEDRDGTLRRRRLRDARTVAAGSGLVVTTSGSTGVPKPVLLSRAALSASTEASVARLGAQLGDRFALALPAHHIAGLQVILRAWHCQTEPVIVGDGGSPAVLAAASQHSEHISLVPTQLRRLVQAASQRTKVAEALGRWRSILVGGAHLDLDLQERAREHGARVVTSYGMTETCGGCVYDGEPLAGVQVTLTSDQRVKLAGPMLFDGYLDADASTPRRPDPSGFVTSDLGAFDDQGRLQILGRADEVVITGGEKVPVAAVATLLRAHPRVSDAEVVGVPDPEWGARVVAVVVAAAGAPAPDLDEVRAHTTQALPRAYAPRQVVVVDEIPRDRMGKTSQKRLRALVAAAG